MEQLELIKEHLWKNQVDEAIRELDALLQDDFAGKDEAYYLRGNAYRKQSNWHTPAAPCWTFWSSTTRICIIIN